ncbi:MAG TPA: LacI family DNA-binding transcriptional regulator [Micropruina sp.]|nr:LacI family DNA-binding transcriptional regulator [Micropruina sp.]
MGTSSGAPVTMKTLAQQLGVSVTTVSNAYSKPDRLSSELREQIFATAKSLGYCGPSAAGRALRSGRTGICGFLFGSHLSAAFSDPFTVLLLAGLSEALEEFDTTVLLLRGDGDENQRLQRAPVDAVVSGSPTGAHPGLDLLPRRGVRVVSTQQSDEPSWVAIDDRFAGRLVGRHLARLGHRRVTVLVPGHLSNRGEVVDELLGADGRLRPDFPGLGCGYAEGRLAGLRETMPAATIRVVSGGENTRETGRSAGGYVLDDQLRPSAVVALSDVLALGVWDAIQQRGLVPGRDVSVAGFDDLPDAEFIGLTTVHQPITEKGRLAGRLAMDPDYPQQQILLPIELKVRTSTGPAPLTTL